MTNLADFLLARIAEDEALARACAQVYPSPWELSDRGWVAYVKADAPQFREVARLEDQSATDGWLGDALGHVARHDPARVLAECEAKRRIVEYYRSVIAGEQGDCGLPYDEGYEDALSYALRLLALPYASHSDYRQEWKP